LPEQLGDSLSAQDRASWRRPARVRHLGVTVDQILICANPGAVLFKIGAASEPSAVGPSSG